MPRAKSIASPSPAVALAEEEAPKGRNIPAQGIALGSRNPTNPSPEGAAQEFSTDESPQGWRKTTFGELDRSVPLNVHILSRCFYLSGVEGGMLPLSSWIVPHPFPDGLEPERSGDSQRQSHPCRFGLNPVPFRI